MRNFGRIVGLATAVSLLLLSCTSTPVEPVAGSGGSETEAMVLGSAFYPDSATPAVGALVYLRTKGSAAGIDQPTDGLLSTIVDRKGRFEFRKVEKGGYLLEIIDTSDLMHPSDLDAVTLNEGDSLVLPLKVLQKPGAISGILEGISDHERVDAKILVRFRDFTVAEATPDSLGRFDFPRLAPKKYNVVVRPSTPDYVTSSTPVEVPSGGTFKMTVGLMPTEWLRFDSTYIQDSLKVKAILDSNRISGTVISRVELGSDLSVVRLDLREEGLTTVPAIIGDLSELRELDLSGNRIQSLPSSIGKLSKLTSLDAQNNLITRLPPEITGIYTLRKLWLSNNRIDALPADMGKWRDLEALYVDTNNLTTLPLSIGNCEALKFLDVSNNKIDTIPSTLGLLVGLQSLRVADNKLDGLPGSLVELKSLASLDLSGNYLCDLSDVLVSWASTFDVDWQGSQFCGGSPGSPYEFFSPREGDRFIPGDTLRIRWATNDPDIEWVRLSISVDSGRSFKELDIRGEKDDDWENYAWLVPDSLTINEQPVSLRSKQGYIRISNYNSAEANGYSGVFSIEGSPLALISPNGGENYQVGDTLSIRWNTAVNSIDIVTCSLSVDNGASWHGAGYSIVEMDEWENVIWIIPQSLATDAGALPTVSDRCRFKVSAYGCSWGYCFQDVSDGPFSISP